MKIVNIKYLNLYIVSGTAFLLAIIFYLVSWFGYYVPRHNYQIGQIAPISIKAPFAFRVLKSDRMLDAEVAIAMESLPPIYKVSEEINFNILRNIDNFFMVVNNLSIDDHDTANVAIHNALNERGYQISNNLLYYLLNNTNRIYVFITDRFAQIMLLPIVEDIDRNKAFRITDSNKTSETSQTTILSKTEAKNRIVLGSSDLTMRQIVAEIADMFIESNLIIDLEAQNTERENIKRSLDPVISRIEANEFIINKNDRLTEHDLLKLDSLNKALSDLRNERNYKQMLLSALGQFLYNLSIFGLFYYLIKIFFKGEYTSIKDLVLINSAFLATIFITVLLYYVFDLKNIILIPIPMFIIVMSILFNGRFGILFSLFILIIAGQYLYWNMLPLINLIIASLACLLVIKKSSQVNYLLIFVYMLASLVITSLITAIFRIESFTDLSLNLFFSLINSVICFFGIYFAVPYLEKRMRYTTKQVLLSLIDSNNPLLKRLAKDAPGTYYHSLTVGVLAEECAEAIGADPMIARVGSYYHDIGKLEQPEYFIENTAAENKHDTLLPTESATIIRNHVKAGIQLAKKAKLPDAIIDIIKQHHGDSKTKYFIHKAKEQGLNFNPDDFEYPGPKPKTKEAIIVMIADIIESTVKSAKTIDEALIKKIIEDTINHLIEDNQMNEAPITIKELFTIKQTIFPIICSIHRRRIEYPNENN